MWTQSGHSLNSSYAARLADMMSLWPEDPALFCQHCQSVADWDWLTVQADRDGMLGVLDLALSQIDCPIPAPVHQQFAHQRAADEIWTKHLANGLEAIVLGLRTAGIEVIVLKGPILSERLFGRPSTRRSCDLDLLIGAKDFESASAALEAESYARQFGPAERYHRRFHHHVSFGRPGQPPLELHFRLFTGFGVEIPSEPFLERARSFTSQNGSKYLVLAPEDEILYLCVHAAGHHFARLSWLYDIKMLLRAHPDINWPRLLARAEELQVETAVSFALTVLRKRLRVAGPPRRREADLAARLLAMLDAAPSDSSRARLLGFALSAALCDRRSAAVWYLQHHGSRVLRRRLQRFLPRWLPADWSA